MKKAYQMVLCGVLVMAMLTGCGAKENAQEPVSTESTVQSTAEAAPESTEAVSTPAETEAPAETAAVETTASNDKVASADEMVTPEDIVEEGMVPIYRASLKDGDYEVVAMSSSSMFNIVACTLHVENGEMTAQMTMGGTGYLYVFMGTGEEAAEADEAEYIPFVENAEGAHIFTVPVEALDSGISCAAFSKKKEKWYDRTILFRADSLPDEAFAESRYTTIEALGLADGTYTVDVTLEGGSGRAKVDSPAVMTISGDSCTVIIKWSSNKYDYMRIGETIYQPISMEEVSIFEIPVTGFDYRMPVAAETTAMSEPHEIDYTLYFDSKSIQAE